jgi:hypothetical protein
VTTCRIVGCRFDDTRSQRYHPVGTDSSEITSPGKEDAVATIAASCRDLIEGAYVESEGAEWRV